MPDRRRPKNWEDGLRIFGERVREFRNMRGMAQEQLAEAAGMSRNRVGTIETGRTYARDADGRPVDKPSIPGYDTIFSLAIALEIDPAELMRLDRPDR